MIAIYSNIVYEPASKSCRERHKLQSAKSYKSCKEVNITPSSFKKRRKITSTVQDTDNLQSFRGGVVEDKVVFKLRDR